MGLRTSGLSVRPPATTQIGVNDVIAANGERKPGFTEARHVIRQLWVTFTRPAAVNMAEMKPKTRTLDQIDHIGRIATWRRTLTS